MASETHSTETIGRHLMAGFLTEIGKWALILTIVFAVLNLARDAIGWGFDDSDDVAAGKHSGLHPLRDHLTGCEYLADHDGALTPRMGADGKQICR